MMGGDRLALVMRFDDEPDPAEVIARFLGGAGYDLVLVEGFKYGPFPRVEVFRRALHDTPLVASAEPEAVSLFLAVVTDDPALAAPCPVIPFDPADPQGTHVATVADLVGRRFLAGDAGER
jgi:molybdopterin-guanine dinucleotide biosynthesis protein